jgi:hypothetical protein
MGYGTAVTQSLPFSLVIIRSKLLSHAHIKAVDPSAKYRATSLGNLESFHPAPALMQSIYIV